MALDVISLTNGILQLLTDMETKTTDSKLQYASTLANLIDTFVKSGTVTTPAGVAVSTTGTATAQTGTTTAPGIGTIN